MQMLRAKEVTGGGYYLASIAVCKADIVKRVPMQKETPSLGSYAEQDNR